MQTQQIIFIIILSSIVGCLAVPTYYPFGPQVNVPESDLVNWVQCWNSTFDESPWNENSNLSKVFANCPGNFWLIGCRQVGSTNLTTLATGERTAIFTQTPLDYTSVSTHNGADWYFYKYSALGFLKQGDTAHKNPCDDAAGNYPGHKLCFATGANPFPADGGFYWGFRCGATMFPEGSTTDRPNWIREIWRYQDPCAGKNEGDECNDGNACIVSTCQSGVCVATNQHVTCNQCSTCDTKSGSCVAINELQSCTDGPACTLGNTCSNGQCTNGTPVQCPDCQLCNNSTSVCEATSATNGWSCDDNNACTLNDFCADGRCQSNTPRDCGQCHECDVYSGCVAAYDGDSCEDDNACTTNTVCSSGQCAGLNVTCELCNECDPSDGCVPVLNGTSCSDGDMCTNDTCQSGVCISDTVTCEVPTGCFNSTCNSLTGQCVNDCPAPVAVPSSAPISEPESNSPNVPSSTPFAGPTTVEPGKTPRSSLLSGADPLLYNIAVLFISVHLLW